MYLFNWLKKTIKCKVRGRKRIFYWGAYGPVAFVWGFFTGCFDVKKNLWFIVRFSGNVSLKIFVPSFEPTLISIDMNNMKTVIQREKRKNTCVTSPTVSREQDLFSIKWPACECRLLSGKKKKYYFRVTSLNRKISMILYGTLFQSVTNFISSFFFFFNYLFEVSYL